jgi:hypothetical protein
MEEADPLSRFDEAYYLRRLEDVKRQYEAALRHLEDVQKELERYFSARTGILKDAAPSASPSSREPSSPPLQQVPSVIPPMPSVPTHTASPSALPLSLPIRPARVFTAPLGKGTLKKTPADNVVKAAHKTRSSRKRTSSS